MKRHAKWWKLLFLPALAFMLLGCSHSAVSTSSWIDFVEVKIWASSGCVQPGDAVKLRATVIDHGNSTEVIDLKNQPVLDLIVYTHSAQIRWSEGKNPASDLARLELGAGQTKSIEMEFTVNQQEPGPTIVSEARFVYDPKFANDPVHPSVIINVSKCPGLLGP